MNLCQMIHPYTYIVHYANLSVNIPHVELISNLVFEEYSGLLHFLFIHIRKTSSYEWLHGCCIMTYNDGALSCENATLVDSDKQLNIKYAYHV